ncbi:MAG: HAMP domain-containing histidine kinase [Leptospiraceae bacterium]|nr:HAMP domain-containing histidine kinase [Leptospiraceae bacterium]MCP5497831.1 HAMP domain-containing histidine kinase [Leptospiraceae bacterium]
MTGKNIGKVAEKHDLDYFFKLKELDLTKKQVQGTTILRFAYPIFIVDHKQKLRVGTTVFEFDRDLLFTPVSEIKTGIVFLSTIILLFSIILTLIFSLFFTKPIYILSDGVKTIGNGNLNHRIKISNRDELGELASSFNQMTESIQKGNEVKDALLLEIKGLNKTKDEFLANISHEIKTPLTVVYAYSEMLSMGKDYPEEVKEYSQEVYIHAQKLNDYVSDVILVTDIESNIQLVKSEVDLSNLIKNVIKKQKPLLEENGIQLDLNIAENIVIHCDQVLISNYRH